MIGGQLRQDPKLLVNNPLQITAEKIVYHKCAYPRGKNFADGYLPLVNIKLISSSPILAVEMDG